MVLLKRIIFKLFDLILPPRCPVTGEIVPTQGTVAPKAWEGLGFISDPQCTCCGMPFEVEVEKGGLCGPCLAEPKTYNRARAALIYNDASRAMILAFKHGDQTHLTRAFLPWLKQGAAELIESDTVLVPVPLHWSRLLKRRYNQAALLAAGLARSEKLPHWPAALQRERRTPPQGHLTRSEREKNVRAAFRVNKKYTQRITGRNIILVDDVYTTGATISECAKILYAAGAARVDVLALARVVRPDNIS